MDRLTQGFAFFGALTLGACSGDDSGGSSGPSGPSGTGLCLGTRNVPAASSTNWCAENMGDNEEDCDAVGCHWQVTGGGSSGYCGGDFPTPCSTYSESDCDDQLLCSWYGPPTCETDAECAEAWLIDDGGCSGVPASIGASCDNQGRRPVFIDFGLLCNGFPADSPATLGCE